MIVARDEPALRWDLAQDIGGVEVVLDRRRGERREGTQAHPEDRRRRDRRHNLDGQRSLHHLGFTIARRWEGGPTTVQMN
jgi:hypothetical protein